MVKRGQCGKHVQVISYPLGVFQSFQPYIIGPKEAEWDKNRTWNDVAGAVICRQCEYFSPLYK